MTLLIPARADSSYMKEVKGSSLSTLSDAFEVLRRFSLLSSNGGRICFAGGQQAIIYVDGRRLSDHSSLFMIPAGTIDRIEIFTEPRAEYGNNGNVIVITTIEPESDEFNLEDQTTVIASPLWGGSNNLELSGRKGKFLYEGGLSLDCSPAKDTEKRFEDSYATQPGSSLKWLDNRTVKDFYTTNRDVSVDVQGKLGFYITPDHQLSLRYEYDFLRSGSLLNDMHCNVFQRNKGIIDLERPSRSYDAESASKYDQHKHSLNLGYEGKAGEWEISANLDLYAGLKNGWETEHESQGESRKCTFDRKYSYNYHEDYFNAYASHPLWKGDIHFGLALEDYVQTTFDDDLTVEDDLVHARTYCFIPAGFAYLEQTFGPVSLDAGILFQAAFYGYKPFGDDQTAKAIREKTGNTDILWREGSLQPHLTVSLTAGEVELSAGINSTTAYPSFSDVSIKVDRIEPGAAYKALPQMETQYSAFVNGFWKWISLKGWGTRNERPLFNDIEERYDFNGPDYWAMDWRLTLSPSVAFWESSLSATFHKQWLSMPVVDAVDDLSAPMCTIQWNNAFELPWGMRLDIGALLRTKGADRNMFYRKPSWKIDAGIQQPFLKDHLTVSLDVENLFARYCDNIAFYKMADSLELYFNERFTGRYVRISLRYKF